MKATIYFHNRCKRSHAALEYLKKHDIDTVVKDYMEEGITRSEIYDILELLNCKITDIIRTEDETIVDKYYDPFDSKEKIIDAVIDHPLLMRRPIILFREAGVGALTRTEQSVNELCSEVGIDIGEEKATKTSSIIHALKKLTKQQNKEAN